MKKLAAVAVVAFSLTSVQAFAGNPVQIWKCGMDGNVSEEAIQEYAAKWEEGAAALPGGKGMSTDVLFPVAAAVVSSHRMLCATSLQFSISNNIFC